MTGMQTTYTTTVTEDRIDHLGHMNVRFYGIDARRGAAALLAEHGVPGLQADDLYTRHHREQLLGAPLAVQVGVLDQGEGWLQLYLELRNTDADELAATFVQRVRPVGGSLPVLPRLPGIPEHGQARTIDLSAAAADTPSLERVRDHDLAMRAERAVSADECDGDVVDPSMAPFLVWGGEPLSRHDGPLVHEGPDGGRFGLATMESRLVIHRLPRVGTRIQSFGATIWVGEKAAHQQMWAFDVDAGEPLVGFEVVNVCLDLDARRSAPIPDDLRVMLEARSMPESPG